MNMMIFVWETNFFSAFEWHSISLDLVITWYSSKIMHRTKRICQSLFFSFSFSVFDSSIKKKPSDWHGKKPNPNGISSHSHEFNKQIDIYPYVYLYIKYEMSACRYRNGPFQAEYSTERRSYFNWVSDFCKLILCIESAADR